MNSRKGSATPLLLFLLLVSVLVNVSFVSGCAWVQSLDGRVKEPPRVEYRDSVEQIQVVANRLGLRVSENKTASDIATDICLRIDESERKMPSPLSEKTIKELETLLTKDEVKVLEAYQKAIRDAQGKRVLYLPAEGE